MQSSGAVFHQPKSVSRGTRESLFFACAKKSNQKKAHPGSAPTLRVGSQSDWEFSEGTSMCRPRHSNKKLPRVVRGAPEGFYPAGLPRFRGPMKAVRSHAS